MSGTAPVRLIAHRLPGSARAVDTLAAAGAGWFELDVQLWRGRLVVSHYLPVLRPPRLRPWLPRWRRDGVRLAWVRTDHGTPLDEAIGMLPTRAGVVLDLKDDRGAAAWLLAERLLSQEVLGRLGPERCLVTSKHWTSLGWLAGHGYPAWRSVATRAALHRLRATAPDPRFAGVTVRHTFLDADVVAGLARFGEVGAWTVPTPSRARDLVARGVSGIVADAPSVLAAVRP